MSDSNKRAVSECVNHGTVGEPLNMLQKFLSVVHFFCVFCCVSVAYVYAKLTRNMCGKYSTRKLHSERCSVPYILYVVATDKQREVTFKR